MIDNDVRILATDDLIERVLRSVLDNYKRQDNPGYSDLDNEQPISIHIHVSLGDLRRLRALERPR